MTQIKLGSRETLKSALRLYGECFYLLPRLVVPLLVLAEAAHLLTGYLKGPSYIAMLIVAWCVSTFANIKALQVLLSRAGGEISSPKAISKSVFFFFLFVTFYVGIASSLAGVFLLIPAVLIYSSAILAPVLVLERTRGPFEAIGESVDQTKGHVWRISIAVLVIWIFLLSLDITRGLLVDSTDLITQALYFLFGVGVALLNLLIYALTAIVYVQLWRNGHLDKSESPAPLSDP